MAATLKDIYEIAVDMGMSYGPRPKKDYQRQLAEMKEKHGKLSNHEKDFFDSDRLWNPFTDTRILYGDPNKKIKKVLVGIDIGTEELLLIKELGRQGIAIDAAIAHHPIGVALARLEETMTIQQDVMANCGVPINVIEKLLDPRIKEVSRAFAPLNKERSVDAARLLDIPLMCMHTVADNQVHDFLSKYLAKKELYYVGDVLKALKEIPEFKLAIKQGAGPTLFAGSEKSKAGKVAVTGMTGGTEGTEKVYEQLARAGVGTIVDMHISESRRKQAEKYLLNVVVSGHMASDSLGMNLILDKIAKKGVEIIACSGLTRVKR